MKSELLLSKQTLNKYHAKTQRLQTYTLNQNTGDEMKRTLAETQPARAIGTVYIMLVVWIIIPVAATESVGFCKYPAMSVTISYHHHSKQIPKQLGIANFINDPIPPYTPLNPISAIVHVHLIKMN